MGRKKVLFDGKTNQKISNLNRNSILIYNFVITISGQ